MCGAADQDGRPGIFRARGCAGLGAMGSSTKVLTKTEPRASGLGLGQLGDVGKQLQVAGPGAKVQPRAGVRARLHEEQSVRDSVFQKSLVPKPQ